MTWRQVLDAVSQVVTLTQQTQKNRDSIKELQEQLNEVRQEMRDMRREMKDMTAGFQQMVYEVTRAYENDAHEREKNGPAPGSADAPLSAAAAARPDRPRTTTLTHYEPVIGMERSVDSSPFSH